MRLFGIDYNRPCPGIAINEPKKKGLRRLIELFSVSYGDFARINLLFFLIISPSAALFFLGFFGVGGAPFYLLSIGAAFPIGGAITACMFCLAKTLRDDPGYLLHDFKRKLMENARQAALPGMIYAAFVYIQIYYWMGAYLGRVAVGYGTLALLFVSSVFFEMIAPYVFLQTAYLELKTSSIIQNSVIIALKNAPKSVCGMLAGRIVWVFFALYFPLSLWWAPLLVLYGFVLPWLVNLMWIWPDVDAIFSIDITLKAVRDSKTRDIEPVFTSHEL